jgi:phospholipase D1/2
MQLRIALGGALVAAVVAAWASGLGDHLHPEALERSIRSAGALGPVVFVVAFALAELIHLPAVVFLLAAAVIWPLPTALATAYAGGLVASIFVVLVARLAVGDLVRKHLVHRLPERLRGFDEKLATGGLREIVVLRLMTFMLPAAHWVVGISKARMRDVVIGTAIGILPGVVLTVVLGKEIAVHWETLRPWVLGGAAILVLVQLVRRWRRWQAAPAARPPEAAPPAAASEASPPGLPWDSGRRPASEA